jgi:hypothetical protein
VVALGGCEVKFGSGGNDSNEVEAKAGPAMTRFVNSRANARSELLQRHYVDFSFDYPADWQVAPQTAGDQASNYVNLTAPTVRGRIPYAVNVGYAFGTGNAESDRREMARALPDIARQFGESWADYRITSVGEDRIGSHDSHSWRFSARTTDAAASQVYGRGDIILPPGATRGVLILSLVTEAASEVRSPADVGESGPIEAIHDSFRLEAEAPAPDK